MSNECNVNLVIKGWEGIPLAIERCGAITIYLPKVLRSFPDFLSCPETILNHLIFHELLHYNEPDLNLD